MERDDLKNEPDMWESSLHPLPLPSNPTVSQPSCVNESLIYIHGLDLLLAMHRNNTPMKYLVAAHIVPICKLVGISLWFALTNLFVVKNWTCILALGLHHPNPLSLSMASILLTLGHLVSLSTSQSSIELPGSIGLCINIYKALWATSCLQKWV